MDINNVISGILSVEGTISLVLEFILDYRLYPNTSHIHPYMYG